MHHSSRAQSQPEHCQLTVPVAQDALATCDSEANVVLLERVDPFCQDGMKTVVLPAVDRLPASSIAMTVTTLSPTTPYAWV